VLIALKAADYRGWLVVEAEQDPAKAPPLVYARRGFVHLSAAVRETGGEEKMTSIWLLPEGRPEQRLQELINRLAEEHATVAFAPHLTCDLAVLDAAAAYVRECGLLPLRVAKAAVTAPSMLPLRQIPGITPVGLFTHTATEWVLAGSRGCPT
jgi:hypothetical protein